MGTLPRMLIVLLLASSLGGPALEAQRPRIAPVGNYHAHIMSEVSGRMLIQRPLPSVALPADLDVLIRDFTRFTKAGDATSLAGLFTEDALYPQQTGWMRGRNAIRRVLSEQGPRDRRIRAHTFALNDSVASIAGTLADSGSRGLVDVAKVMMTLRRSADGKWLIASFLRENVPSGVGTPFSAEQLVTQLDSGGHPERARALGGVLVRIFAHAGSRPERGAR